MAQRELRIIRNERDVALAKCNKLQERLNKSSDAYAKVKHEHERLARDLIGLGTGVDLTRDEIKALHIAIAAVPANTELSRAWSKLHAAFLRLERGD